MSEHTSVPWEAEDTMGVRCVCIVHTDGHFDGDWFVNASVQNRASAEDDAKFIAHAANHHDELLAACEGLVGWVGTQPGCDCDKCQAFHRADAAIATAKRASDA